MADPSKGDSGSNHDDRGPMSGAFGVGALALASGAAAFVIYGCLIASALGVAGGVVLWLRFGGYATLGLVAFLALVAVVVAIRRRAVPKAQIKRNASSARATGEVSTTRVRLAEETVEPDDMRE